MINNEIKMKLEKNKNWKKNYILKKIYKEWFKQ